jgi:hypothetical protein
MKVTIEQEVILEYQKVFSRETKNETTLLDSAACYGHEKLVRLLLDYEPDDFGRRSYALQHACEYGHDRILNLLHVVSHYINYDTYLKYAAVGGYHKVVKFLLQFYVSSDGLGKAHKMAQNYRYRKDSQPGSRKCIKLIEDRIQAKIVEDLERERERRREAIGGMNGIGTRHDRGPGIMRRREIVREDVFETLH